MLLFIAVKDAMPKKKKKNRVKEYDKKDTPGDLMDAYTERPAKVEVRHLVNVLIQKKMFLILIVVT